MQTLTKEYPSHYEIELAMVEVRKKDVEYRIVMHKQHVAQVQDLERGWERSMWGRVSRRRRWMVVRRSAVGISGLYKHTIGSVSSGVKALDSCVGAPEVLGD